MYTACGGEQTAVMSSGARVRYQPLWLHATGGLGEIFAAEDTELHRRVALKQIQRMHATNPHSRERFVAEAEITGNLEHPGIVPVYGLGTDAVGRPYYAMRFVQGEALSTAIHRFHAGPEADFMGSEFRWLLRRFMDVCNPIAYAHSRGILHRDLKPGNIMLGSFGETLVMDWGVAKVMA
jgi:serine/threonine protein kinase